MIKISVRNKPLFLVDKLEQPADDYVHRPDTLFLDEFSQQAIRTMLHKLETDDALYAGVFLHSRLDELFEGFLKELTLIKAAGGLVFTPQQDLLLIFRKGKWDLPKGKLEEGEELIPCASREITEETGAGNLTYLQPITVTYHTYYQGSQHILKESHWYLSRTGKKSPLSAQSEEDIEQCLWVPKTALEIYTSNMHATIHEVLGKGLQALPC